MQTPPFSWAVRTAWRLYAPSLLRAPLAKKLTCSSSEPTAVVPFRHEEELYAPFGIMCSILRCRTGLRDNFPGDIPASNPCRHEFLLSREECTCLGGGESTLSAGWWKVLDIFLGMLFDRLDSVAELRRGGNDLMKKTSSEVIFLLPMVLLKCGLCSLTSGTVVSKIRVCPNQGDVTNLERPSEVTGTYDLLLNIIHHRQCTTVMPTLGLCHKELNYL